MHFKSLLRIGNTCYLNIMISVLEHKGCEREDEAVVCSLYLLAEELSAKVKR